jgi:hypothetical protein
MVLIECWYYRILEKNGEGSNVLRFCLTKSPKIVIEIKQSKRPKNQTINPTLLSHYPIPLQKEIKTIKIPG